ncbi:TPA: hypothetical protein P7484_005696 [Klebsiella pneumoniae]|jgi:hypothetical protein|uniref:hypothetical protein n=1 Tax=Enterobacteriaceae TaxID=543 RepID=UPI000460F9A2|nr:hypothetical protein [Klebsiella pneumoniae]ECI2792855.1 hypothetical protein [Salmonella enterica subsp. enterica serovar Give]EIY5093674.1 hypothetical protein [Klebsiella quasipneumoniae]ELY7233748.1 hypothetical protein [Klebsiella variicola]SQZ76992.1 Uncharacterised protein [Escherichia coli]HDU6243690.1 hypothetical protein [Klebsiella aerogenes]
MIKKIPIKLLTICMIVLYFILIVALIIFLKITSYFQFKDVLAAIVMLAVILSPWVIISARVMYDKKD